MAFTTGLKSDCETLLCRFQKTDSVRYEEFAVIWREMNFSSIFYGKMGDLEKNSFTKETLTLACQYILPPYSFQIRVGGLYLLYGLYHSQLCQPKQKIRIALKDWDDLISFQQDLLHAHHYDAAFIFRKLRVAKAFHYSAMPKLLCYRTKKKIGQDAVKEEFREKPNNINEVLSTDVLEEIVNIHEHYQQMKCLISADRNQPDKALSLIKEEFVINLKNIALEHQQWWMNKTRPHLKMEKESESEVSKDRDEGTSFESEGSERARRLAQIKSKSYTHVAQASKSRRHRQVKMDSSESGSDHERVKRARGRKRSKTSGVKTRKELLSSKDNKMVTKETSIRRPSMPVITEEEDSSCGEGTSSPDKKRARH